MPENYTKGMGNWVMNVLNTITRGKLIEMIMKLRVIEEGQSENFIRKFKEDKKFYEWIDTEWYA
jgi:hypothetical protein